MPLLVDLLVCVVAFQLRAECHAFHFSQGLRISVLRQELQNISRIELQCTIVEGLSGCSCSSTYIGDTGKESIWLLTTEPTNRCNVSSEVIVNAMYKQTYGVSSSEIRLQVTNGAVPGYCGMDLGWIRPVIPFLTPSQVTRINLDSRDHRLRARDVSRTRPSALCPDHTIQRLQDNIKDSTRKSHAALVQEIEAVAHRLGSLARPDARLILLAAENKYMSLRAATLNAFARFVCHGLSVKYLHDHSTQITSISFHASSTKELTNMLMRIILDLLYALSDSSESGVNRISEILFGLSISKLKTLIEQRAAVCLIHGVRIIHEYTFLDPDLSGFMHCLLQSDFMPSVELTADRHGIDMAKAVNTLQKQQTIVKLSPRALGITSIRMIAHLWGQWHLVCLIAFLFMLVLIAATHIIYLKWQVIRHLFFSKRPSFKHEEIPLHINAHEMV